MNSNILGRTNYSCNLIKSALNLITACSRLRKPDVLKVNLSNTNYIIATNYKITTLQLTFQSSELLYIQDTWQFHLIKSEIMDHYQNVNIPANVTGVWVTFVEKDESVEHAFVLAHSIRKTVTSGKLWALYGHNISKDSRNKLLEVFDELINIGPPRHWLEAEDLETFARIHCWTLPGIQKCIFLNCKSLVLKNCDDLFGLDGISTGRTDVDQNVDTSLLVLTPSWNIYERILEQIEAKSQKPGQSKLSVFEKYLSEEIKVNIFDNICVNVSRQSKGTQRQFSDASIVRFAEDFVLDVTNTMDDSITAVVNIWKRFREEISVLQPVRVQPIDRSVDEKEAIAIVGISCRFPDANNLDEFWELMMTQGDAIRTLPDDRWLLEQSCSLKAEGREMKSGFLKCPVDTFDHHFFGKTPMELAYTDPQQRLLLKITWEALEDAAIVPSSLKGTNVGVFAGISSQEYGSLMVGSNFGNQDGDFFRTYMGNSFGAAPATIAHFLGVTGPNVAAESGCSSSLVSVGLAVNSLRNRDSEIALACGTNLLLCPYSSKGSEILSPDGRCKTFDETANGFGRAEGVAVLVLKRVSTAVSDGDRIYGLIKGYGVAQEGLTSSMGTPTAECESLAMKRALTDANVHPSQIDFVEAHGTGTSIGDPKEIHAITEVYSVGREKTLVIGSVKTNVGHTEACSGITGIVKTILALQNEVIPPHRWLNKLNPKINLEKIPAIIPLHPEPWPKVIGQRRMAGVSSYGLSGTTAHVILEEAPVISNNLSILNAHETQLPLPLTLSAKSEKALDELILNYQKYLEQNKPDLNDVVYTANAGRDHFNHRVFIVGNSCEEIVQKIENKAFEVEVVASGEKPKLCFLYTGHGSQYSGMGRYLYQNFVVFRNNFDLCDSILQSLSGLSICKALWEDDEEIFNKACYTQTSIFAIEFCLTKLLEFWGIRPDIVLGHSLGEFAAATAAGMITLNNAMKMVETRSRLIDNLPQGRMLVIKASSKFTNDLIQVFLKTMDEPNPQTSTQQRGWLDVASFNSTDQTTVSGLEEYVLKFEKFCLNNNIRTQLLIASHAFHSRMMDKMLDEYVAVVNEIKFSEPNCIYISGANGSRLNSAMNAEYWRHHTRQAVQFQDASLAAYDTGCTVFIEIGPTPVLSPLISRNVEEIKDSEPLLFCPSMKKDKEADGNEWTVLLDMISSLYLKGVKIDWKSFHKYHRKQKISLPFYPFQEHKHWFDPEVNLGLRLNQQAKSIHELLGSPLITPTRDKTFSSFITLETAPYLKDCKVGDHVIFPCGAYIEMSCIASYAALFTSLEDVDMPETGIMLENLIIKNQLTMSENKTYELQTVASRLDKSDCYNTKVCIYSRPRGLLSTESVNWTWQSEATLNNGFENSKANDDIVDISQLKTRISELIEESDNNNTSTSSKTWRNGDEFLSEIEVPDNDENLYEYLCHPLIVDAMFQLYHTSSCTSDTLSDIVYHPVSVKKFKWLRRSQTLLNYIHISSTSNETGIEAVLYDSNGLRLASMSGVEFEIITPGKIEKSLKNEISNLIPMYKDNWRFSRAKSLATFEGPCLEVIENDMSATLDSLKPEANNQQGLLNEMVTAGIIKTFLELGWKSLEIGNTFQVLKVMDDMKIVDSFLCTIRRFFEILSEDGFFIQSSKDKDEFKVTKKFPSLKQQVITVEGLNSKYQGDLNATSIFEYMFDILRGSVSALSVLFPEKDTKFSAANVYKESGQSGCNAVLDSSLDFFFQAWTHKKTQNLNTNEEIRILEIGAGTGSATKIMIPMLQKYGIKYFYEFTDISSSFFIKAKEHFAEIEESMCYRVLNIELDPMTQGFAPQQYDIIIAGNVLHATMNLRQTCRNVRHLLKPSGTLFIAEVFIPLPQLDIIFGLLPGFWRFTDFDLRRNHCLMSETMWKTLLCETGFTTATSLSVADGSEGVVVAQASSNVDIEFIFNAQIDSVTLQPPTFAWIVFSDESEVSKILTNKLRQSARLVIEIKRGEIYQNHSPSEFTIRPDHAEDIVMAFRTIQIEQSKSTEIEGIIYSWGMDNLLSTEVVTRPYLYLLQTLLVSYSPFPPKHFVITQGIAYVEDQEPKNPASATLWGLSRTYRSENKELYCQIIDLDPNEEEAVNKCQHVINELWKFDLEPSVAYRQGIRYIDRLSAEIDENLSLLTLKSDRFQLLFPNSSTTTIADLKFGFLPRIMLSGNKVEVLVKATGLNYDNEEFNFGMDKASAFSSVLGTDFSGMIVAIGPDVKNKKVGDFVFGYSRGSEMLPSHLTISQDELVILPEDMTFGQGATLASGFATTYHCLVTIGKLSEGKTLLINTATEPVGLYAIQIAMKLGATVIVTVNTRRHRAYLKTLGLKNVFNLAQRNFKEKIMKYITGITRIDVVLNAMAGPEFNTLSLGCCIDKNPKQTIDLIQSIPETLLELNPHFQFTRPNFKNTDIQNKKEIMKTLEEYLKMQWIRPVAYTSFDALNVQNAIVHLQKFPIIGKTVFLQPEVVCGNTMEVKTPLFNDRSTYLVTGGLKGIGFTVALWMLESGAKNVVLCGRRPSPKENREIIDKLNSKSANILEILADIGDSESVKNLLKQIKDHEGFPPLRGVMHVAGAWDDGTIPNQTWSRFQNALLPKVDGGWNLHSQTLDCQLEHFVLFSSVATIFGSAGLSNYVAGNTYLDVLANYRNASGLPATSLNWGQWGESGVATDMSLYGFTPFSNYKAFSSLEYVMKSYAPQTMVCDADNELLTTGNPWTKIYLSELRFKTTADKDLKSTISAQEFSKAMSGITDPEKHYEIIQKYVLWIISTTIKLDEIEMHRHFVDFGIDSLMMIELRQRIQALLGQKFVLSAADLADCDTLHLLTNKIRTIICAEPADEL